MKVILKEQVKSLGNVGDIVEVDHGYARNYLLPKKYAVIATEINKSFIDDQKKRLANKIEEEKKGFLALKKKIESTQLELFKRISGSGNLFGGVSAMELVKELSLKDLEVEKRWFIMDGPLRKPGEFTVVVRPCSDVEANLKVSVKVDPKQLEELKKKQEMAKAKKEAEAKELAAKKAAEEASEDTAEEIE